MECNSAPVADATAPSSRTVAIVCTALHYNVNHYCNNVKKVSRLTSATSAVCHLSHAWSAGRQRHILKLFGE